MQLVVVSAVRKAVRAATNIFTVTSIKRFFFNIGRFKGFKEFKHHRLRRFNRFRAACHHEFWFVISQILERDATQVSRLLLLSLRIGKISRLSKAAKPLRGSFEGFFSGRPAGGNLSKSYSKSFKILFP